MPPEDKGKKTPQELTQELEKIYADPEGKLPDFTRLDGKPGSRLKSAVVGVLASLAVVAAVSWAGIFFFSRTAGFTGEGVEVRIESAERLPAGDESEIVVRWKNAEGSKVHIVRDSWRMLLDVLKVRRTVARVSVNTPRA